MEKFKFFWMNFEKIKDKYERLTIGLIWLAVAWTIWLVRNDIVFNGKRVIFYDCYTAIINASWKWFRILNGSSLSCSFHFWNILPLFCIKS